MSTPASKPFALAVMLAFCFELFIPLSYSYDFYGYYDDPASASTASPASGSAVFFADPTPTPAPPIITRTVSTPSFGCQVKQMSREEANRYLRTMPQFEAEQISSAPAADLRKTDPTNQEDMSRIINVNVNLNQGAAFKFKELMDVMQLEDKTRKELAAEFKVDPETGSLNLEQVQSLAARNPDKSDKISEFLGLKAKSTVAPQVYDGLKVRTPSAKSIPLTQLFSLKEQNSEDNCLLDSTHIAGKISFGALLDRDLYVGFHESKTVVKSGQHVSSRDTTASLNLQDGKAIILPDLFEKYVNKLGFYSRLDMIITTATAAFYASKLRGPGSIQSEIKILEKKKEEIRGLHAAGVVGLKGDFVSSGDKVNGPILSKARALVNTEEWGQQVAEDKLQTILRESWESGLGVFDRTAHVDVGAGGVKLLKTTPGAVPSEVRELVDSRVATLRGVYGFHSADQLEDAAIGELLTAKSNFPKVFDASTGKVSGELLKEGMNGEAQFSYIAEKLSFPLEDKSAIRGLSVIDQLEMLRKKEDLIAKQLPARLQKSALVAAYGLGWMLPARFALEASNAVLFSTGATNRADLKDKYLQFYVNNNKFAEKFRQNTDFLATGGIIDFASDMLGSGVPTKTFRAGNLYFINRDTTPDEQYSNSFTGFNHMGASWQINLGWKGKSEATVFEDVRQEKEYTSLALFSHDLNIGASIDRNKLLPDYYNALQLVAPVLSLVILRKADPSVLGPTLAALMQLQTYEFIMHNFVSKERFSPNEICDEDAAMKYADVYLALTGVSAVQNLYPFSGLITKGGQLVIKNGVLPRLGDALVKGGYIAQTLNKALVFVDPVLLGRQLLASRGMEYVSTCKDTSYKFMAYQQIGGGMAPTSVNDKIKGLTEGFGKLNVTGLLNRVGSKLDESRLTEMLNMRMLFQDEVGMLKPSDLYYIHLDGATQAWWGVYYNAEQRGCFRVCQDSKDEIVCNDGQTIEKTNKKTGEKTVLSDDADRAKLTQNNQQLARTIVPNKIIDAPLYCGGTEILAVTPGKYGGTLAVTDNSCDAAACLRTQLSQITGIPATDDLSESGFGAVTAVYTTKGIVTAADGRLRYLQNSGSRKTVLGLFGEEDLTGTEIQAPSLEALEKLPAKDLADANKVSILGDGKVTLSGYTSEDFGEEELGTLMTVFTENGRIEYDPVQQRLVATIYQIAYAKVDQQVKDIGIVQPSVVKDENGHDMPAIQISNIIPKVGSEKEVEHLNTALKEIQKDTVTGAPGGFTVLETPDTKYVLTTDPKTGEQKLQVIEKTKETHTITNPDGSTSQVERTVEQTAKEYSVTGPVRQEGNDVVVPTDKGDFRFNISTQDGKPTLAASGPDGFRDIATLLAAKGPNGILAFDPRTGLWYALNGQDIPWNPDFANKGLSYYNSDSGARGVVGDNLFANPRRATGTATTASNPLALPSWPAENPVVVVLMLFSVVAGAVVIRFRKSSEV
ncbi:MAG: hypothetical protein V1787_06585 [Candidatus Micrarchaeota archaeon]